MQINIHLITFQKQLDIFNWISFFFFLYLTLFILSIFRSGLFTDILLVLIVSITCVQTKEIKNSFDFQEISAKNHSSISDPSFSNDHAFDNHTWPHQFTKISSTNIKIDIDNNKNGTSDKKLPHSKYSINNRDQIEISSDNELSISELPIPIKNEFYTNTVHIEQTTERNGKESNILRSALRVAARQGLEAMVELYDKKEPNLIRKGQY